MSGVIRIRYKCRCLPAEASFEIPAREADEDIADWMRERVGPALHRDHLRRSPDCRATATEYVKIPAPENAPFLGAAPRLDS